MKKIILKILEPVLVLIGFLIKAFNLPMKQGDLRIHFPSFMNKRELGALVFRKYEKNEIYLVNKYIKKTDVVLEMGACIGVVSLTINNLLSDKTKQVSVEPNPQMQEYLYINKKNNDGQFFIENCIVSKLKEVDFFLGSHAFLSSSTLSGGEKVIIPGKTLKELIDKYFEFSAIVMDIEGGELEFFRSFDLGRSKIRLVIWETHMQPKLLSESELTECYEKLKQQGFSRIEKIDNVEAWTRDLN